MAYHLFNLSQILLSGKEPRTSLLFFILITSPRSWLSSKEKSFDQFMTSYTCANELKTTGQLACHQLSDLLLHRYFTAHLIQITNYCMSQIFWIMVSWIIELVNVKSMHYKGLLCCSVWRILHKSWLFIFSNNLTPHSSTHCPLMNAFQKFPPHLNL